MILCAVQYAQCNTKNHRNSLFIMIVSLIKAKMIMITKFITNIQDNHMIIILYIILTIKMITITLMMKILKVFIHGLYSVLFLTSLLQL